MFDEKYLIFPVPALYQIPIRYCQGTEMKYVTKLINLIQCSLSPKLTPSFNFQQFIVFWLQICVCAYIHIHPSLFKPNWAPFRAYPIPFKITA